MTTKVTTNVTTHASLEVRLARVERHLARQRYVSFLLAGLCGAFALASAQAVQRVQKPPVLTVSALEVVDDAGRVAARLGYSQTGGRFDLRNTSDQVAISAMATAQGGLFTVHEADGSVATRLFHGPHGAQVVLNRKDGQPTLTLAASRMASEVTIHDRKGLPVASLRGDGRGRGEIELLDRDAQQTKTLKF